MKIKLKSLTQTVLIATIESSRKEEQSMPKKYPIKKQILTNLLRMNDSSNLDLQLRACVFTVSHS
jgi:hypothetical protein